MARTRHGSGSVSRGSHTGGSLTDFRSPGGALIGNSVWGTNVTSDDGSLGLVTALEVTPGAIGPGAITTGGVVDGNIAPGVVVGSISTGTITGVMIGTDTITAANIAANTITASEIAANTITGSQIAADTITATQIAADSITSNEIATGTITANEIQSGTITASEISTGTISAIEVSAAALAADSITASDIFGTTITGLSFHAGGGSSTQINVYDTASNLIGYWDTAGLHVYDGKFFLEGLQLRYAVSNSIGFWDFESRAIRATKGVVTVEYSGAITDYVMDYMTLNGALAVDGYHGRMYFRYGGSWHYSAQTAGFEIPNYETICPVCDLPLLPGQDLIGRGDRLRDDGALHALYIHLSCAGVPMSQTIADEYDALADHADLDADPVKKDEYEKLSAKLIKKALKAQDDAGVKRKE